MKSIMEAKDVEKKEKKERTLQCFGESLKKRYEPKCKVKFRYENMNSFQKQTQKPAQIHRSVTCSSKLKTTLL